MHRFVELSLAVALEEEGVRETGGANWGKRVSEYLKATRINFPAAWCAAFVRWSLLNAAKRLPIDEKDVPILSRVDARKFAFCPTIAAWGEEEGILENAPKPGDLFLLMGNNGRGRARHVGFVLDTSSSHFRTIEGNTNLGGSPEGIGVFKRTRPRSGPYRFVRYGELIENAMTEEYDLVLNTTKLFKMPLVGGRSLAPVRAWGEALGFEVTWDVATQTVLYDGQEVDSEVTLIDGTGHAPIRDLVRAAGLQLRVDNAARKVIVSR